MKIDEINKITKSKEYWNHELTRNSLHFSSCDKGKLWSLITPMPPLNGAVQTCKVVGGIRLNIEPKKLARHIGGHPGGGSKWRPAPFWPHPSHDDPTQMKCRWKADIMGITTHQTPNSCHYQGACNSLPRLLQKLPKVDPGDRKSVV